MALWPWMLSNPPSYDPYNTIIERGPKGYAIGWSPIDFWKLSLWFEGTIKELAKQIFIYYSNSLRVRQDYPNIWTMGEDQDTFLLGVFWITFKSTISCRLQDNCSFGKDIDGEAFLQELTAELNRLKPLMVFA